MTKSNQRLNATIAIGAALEHSFGRTIDTANRKLGSVGQVGGASGIGGTFARAQSRVGDAIRRNNEAIAETRGKLFDAAAGYFVLKEAIGAPIADAMRFETVLENIGQKADIQRDKLSGIGDAIMELSGKTGRSIDDIGASVDSLVGRGASLDVALAASEPIARAAFAYQASSEDLAAASWAAIDNLKVSASDVGTVMDIMSTAGKEGAFELKDMAQYLPALGAAYQALGQTGVGAVGDISAALQISRKSTGDASTAANNLANLMQKIYAPATVKKFGEAGVDLIAEMEAAATRGLTPIEAIAEITEKTLNGDLSKMGNLFEDAQAQAALRALIQNVDEYRRIRGEAMSSKGVVDEDYQRRAETAAGAFERWDSAVGRLSTTFGESLLPVLTDLVDVTIPFVEAIGSLVRSSPGLTAGLVGAAAGLLAFKTALTGLRFIGLLGKGGALSLVGGGLEIIGKTGGRLFSAAKGTIELQSALAKMSGAKFGFLDKLGAGLRGIVDAIPGTRQLGDALRSVKSSIGSVLERIGLIGPKMDSAAAQTERAAGRMSRAVNRVRFGGLLFGAQAFSMLSSMPDNPEDVATWQKGNRDSMDRTLRNTPLIGGMMGAYEGARDWLHGEPEEKKAVGGYIRQNGPVLVGERGPEVLFGARAGFVATNRQLRQLLSLASGAGEGLAGIRQQAMQSMPDLSQILGGRAPAARGQGEKSAPDRGGLTLVQHINITSAQNLDPRALAEMIGREAERRARGALFDRSSFA